MKRNQLGFTIVELLIATTVFSVVMVLCLAAFLRVGQLYYKGLFLARTQEATRNISDDITNQLRLNGGGTDLVRVPATNVFYMCAGSKRYSFMSNNVVNTQTESDSNYGLVRDNLPSLGCVSPIASNFDNTKTELLNDKMRIVATGTLTNQTDLYTDCKTVSTRRICNVHVHVDFGDNDLLVNPANNASFTTAINVVSSGNCSGPLAGSQFCATTDLDTTIYPLQ